MLGSVLMPGRTRWPIFDEQQDVFFINIAAPPRIAIINAGNFGEIAEAYTVPVDGPHGLAPDRSAQRLFCACDAKRLVCLDARSCEVLSDLALSRAPDVIFFNENFRRLYVAIGDPSVIDVVDTGP